MDTLFSFIFLSLPWESSIVIIIKTLFNFLKAGGGKKACFVCITLNLTCLICGTLHFKRNKKEVQLY